MTFRKRTYRNPADLWRDLMVPFKNRKLLKKAADENLVSPAFRERLMLAVTGVNGCRYCSYFHTKQALKSGVGPVEISRLLEGDVADCPGDEAAAVLFAQHWAESNARPDPETVQKLREAYGPEKARIITTYLHMVRTGNLLGNTWDYLMYLVTFRWMRKTV